MHTLYLVSVPIGNLEEITYLGKRILSEKRIIFCEDTRVTWKLLNLLNIYSNQELIKLNQFNEKESLERIIGVLEKEDCVLVSDAGYPVISDPGYFLVSDLRKRNIPVQVVNGPCAFIHAVVSSGLDSRRIFFANFLTKKYLKRKKELEGFKPILKEATIVYYETKNFLPRGLEIIKEVYGDIKLGIGRELSKINETFYYDKISNLQEIVTVKGEFVVIIPRQECVKEEEDLNVILDGIHSDFLDKKGRLRELCKEVSSDKYSSKEIYEEYVKRYKG